MPSWPARRTMSVSYHALAYKSVADRVSARLRCSAPESSLVLFALQRASQNRITHEHGEVLVMPLLDVLEPGM